VAKFDRLLAQAKEHLEEGEEVLASVKGSYETKRMGQDSVRKGILAASDRRLVFFAKKMTGYDLEVFPYENISSIEMGKSMMGHHIKFFASGNEVKLKWIDKKEDVGAFVGEVKSRMKGGTPAPGAAPGDTAPDIGTQIRQLAQLRDEGLLTQEEFDAKKADLLAKM
jgi:hypothetical protein